MSPDAARRAALLDFGGVERFKEEVREVRGIRPIEDLARDLRYAVRVLRRSPAFTAATVLTLALGIGAATAITSVVYGVVLRPLPYLNPDELTVLWERDVTHGHDRNVVSVENFEAWRNRSRSFLGMAALVPTRITLAGGAEAQRVPGAEVSPGYFRLLGVAPALGREFTREEESAGGAPVVMLSDGFWRRRFGGDPGVLGRSLPISGKPHSIVGIMPARFQPPRFSWLDEQDFWVPFAPTADKRTWGRFLLVVARLRPGVELEQARAEMVAIASQRALEDTANQGWSASVIGLGEQITGDVRTALFVILGAGGLLLLMAVTNVGTLTLAFMRRHRHEMALRRAIGATDRRLYRQLFTQSALLGAMGTALGLLAAVPGVRLLVALIPPEVPRAESIHLDTAVLLVSTAAAVIATLIFGTAAAARGSSEDGASVIAESSHERISPRLGGYALIVTEIALGVVLAILAGLMVRSFASLQAVNLGFRTEGIVIARIALSGDRSATPAGQRAFFDALAERIRAIPAVRSAGLVSIRPFGGAGPATTVGDARRRMARDAEPIVADIRYADRPYFGTLGIPTIAGSLFDERERPDGPPRVVINETMARAFWPGKDPIGQSAAIQLFDGITPVVIGVVGDVHLMDARTPPRATAYLAASRFPSEVFDLIVRVDHDPASFVPTLRSAVARFDPGLPLYQVTTMRQLVDESLARDRFTTLLLGGFASIALLLAGVGVYGVFAGDVARRRKEIGIRLALGARRSGVLLLILRLALARAAAGVFLGVVAALLVARAMASLLFGVGAADPVTFIAIAATLLGVALAATLIPAIQAARVPPIETVRNG
jgi:putative ABC transport system permease protein